MRGIEAHALAAAVLAAAAIAPGLTGCGPSAATKPSAALAPGLAGGGPSAATKPSATLAPGLAGGGPSAATKRSAEDPDGARATHSPQTAPALGPVDATFRLELRQAPTPRLFISLVVARAPSPLVVGCDRWGRVKRCEDEIGEVRAIGRGGASLPVDRVDNEWTIRSAPGDTVTLSYELTPSNRAALTSPSTRFFPVVNDEYLHVVGHVGLLVPREIPPNRARKRSVELKWQGFAEAGWSFASSLGQGTPVRRRISYAEVAQSIFVAGDYRLIHSASEDGVTLAIRPRAWRFGATDVLATAAPVIEEVRRVFRAAPAPLLITATPIPLDEDAIFGTMLADGVALFLPRPGRRIPAPLLGLLVAHEYFHHFNAHLMRPAEAEGPALFWFTEGFAEFYMRRIALRAGRISKHDYIGHLNQATRAFRDSSVNDAPNATIADRFGESPSMNRLPYQRGQIVALLVDAELRRASGGKETLDTLMRTLLSHVEKTGTGITTTSVLDAIAAATSPAFASTIRDIVVAGQLPVIPADALAPCVTLDANPQSPHPWHLDPKDAATASCVRIL